MARWMAVAMVGIDREQFIKWLFGKAMPEPNSGCWLWVKATTGQGYGNINGRSAHLVIYEKLIGPVPEGLQLDHKCRVRCCVNPDHLEPVTCKENLHRGIGSTATKANQTHCIHGHEFTLENTRIRRNGVRQCRACDAGRARQRRRARWLAR